MVFLKEIFLAHILIEYVNFQIYLNQKWESNTDQIGPDNNGNEGIVCTLMISRNGASPSDAVYIISLTNTVFLQNLLYEGYKFALVLFKRIESEIICVSFSGFPFIYFIYLFILFIYLFYLFIYFLPFKLICAVLYLEIIHSFHDTLI